MSWNDNLLPEQETAASYLGTHARLLAGPGTGKTLVLTRRIIYLIQEMNVSPNEILALTFTRAAAHELLQRVSKELGNQNIPNIVTLHSFALRQLLRNARRVIHLPQPLRIADDWEERNIVQEDLKTALQLSNIRDAQELFNQLSADWESLAPEEGRITADPHFIGAWEEHRKIYGYTIRAELVYQLKRSLEQIGDFELEFPARYLLVDEYQDLNLCDLAIIRAIVDRGAELFIAGDDDQSIYGFRKAYPDGIRQFHQNYNGAFDLNLNTCMRCDQEILNLAEFVANLDYRRIPKGIHSVGNNPPGEVHLLQFNNGNSEAAGIAMLCDNLIKLDNIQPEEILILLRSDTRRAFSRKLESVFNQLNIPIAIDSSSFGPLDDIEGRQFLSILRLAENPNDHLAWTTLLRLRRNNIGPKGISKLYELTRIRGEQITQTILAINADTKILPKFGSQISREYNEIIQITQQIQTIVNNSAANRIPFQNSLEQISASLGISAQITNFVIEIAQASKAESISDLLVSIESTSLNIEPELVSGNVNVLTMHKAKGLTAEAVIVMAAEDEYIPGRQNNEPELGDERRLLYVSLTRAKHKLYITYCNHRYGQQKMLGRTPGIINRSLTQFLRHTPLRPITM